MNEPTDQVKTLALKVFEHNVIVEVRIARDGKSIHFSESHEHFEESHLPMDQRSPDPLRGLVCAHVYVVVQDGVGTVYWKTKRGYKERPHQMVLTAMKTAENLFIDLVSRHMKHLRDNLLPQDLQQIRSLIREQTAISGMIPDEGYQARRTAFLKKALSYHLTQAMNYAQSLKLDVGTLEQMLESIKPEPEETTT